MSCAWSAPHSPLHAERHVVPGAFAFPRLSAAVGCSTPSGAFPFPIGKTVLTSPLTERHGRYQPETHSSQCRLCAALHAKLDQNMADMGLDGLFTKSKMLSDLFVR